MRDEMIMAAGGVVARETAVGREFLVIHRRRYGDSKGKVKAGEAAELAALREVREETGYEVELGGALGEMHYMVNGVPKIVRLWHMRPAGPSHGIEDRSEVQDVFWMSGEEARERLSYPLEKEMLARAMRSRHR